MRFRSCDISLSHGSFFATVSAVRSYKYILAGILIYGEVEQVVVLLKQPAFSRTVKLHATKKVPTVLRAIFPLFLIWVLSEPLS